MTNEMMNEEEIAIAIAIIRNEYLCVDRDCNIERNCGKCDLAMQSKEPILKAFKMAMQALETIPKYGAKASYEHLKMCEEEQSGDLISRQAVLDIIHLFFTEEVDKIPTKKTEDGEVLIMCKAQPLFAMNKTLCKRIKELPSVTAEPKTGHWIIKDGKEQGYDIGGIKTWYIQIMCDKCGFIKTAIEGHTGQYKYCPNCGARMVGDKE